MRRIAAISSCLLACAAICDAQQIKLVAPARVAAGTLVRVEVATDLISDKLPIRWSLPSGEIKQPDGSALQFADAAQLAPLGRGVLFAWPMAGKLTFRVQAGVPVRDGNEIIGFEIVEASATVEQVGGAVGPEPAVPLLRPTPPLDRAVSSITDKLVGKVPIAQDLSRFYAATATAIERGACQSTGAVRALLVQAAKLSFYGQLVGQTPGLGAEVDRVLLGQLGSDESPLDAAKRGQVVAVFRALAWACAEAR